MTTKLLPENAEGYPLVYITHHGLILCNECMTAAIHAEDEPEESGRGQVHWEGAAFPCDECDHPIQSAYGEPDEVLI